MTINVRLQHPHGFGSGCEKDMIVVMYHPITGEVHYTDILTPGSGVRDYCIHDGQAIKILEGRPEDGRPKG